MAYTIVHFPLIGATIRPGVAALAPGHVAHKVSLLDKIHIIYFNAFMNPVKVFFLICFLINLHYFIWFRTDAEGMCTNVGDTWGIVKLFESCKQCHLKWDSY